MLFLFTAAFYSGWVVAPQGLKVTTETLSSTLPRSFRLATMLVELDPIITTTVHNHVAHELPLLLLAKGDVMSLDSFKNYVEMQEGLVKTEDLGKALKPLQDTMNFNFFFSTAFNCLNLVATLGGFSWMRGQLAPLQLDVLNRATKDATLTPASDKDHLTLTLKVSNLLNPSKDEFSTTCENNIVIIVWARGKASMTWTEPVPPGKKLATDFALEIAPRMKTTQCTFSTNLLDVVPAVGVEDVVPDAQ